MTLQKPNCFAIIPAAGIGSRMNSQIPKQYLRFQGKTILEHSLSKFLYHPLIKKVLVVVHSQDLLWHQFQLESYYEKISVVTGGAERKDSVLNGLLNLASMANAQDWVLVHDAVRPFLQASDLDKLMTEIGDHPVGGILGTRVRDTLKEVDTQNLRVNTIQRDNVWQALTPQMFRFNLLLQALQDAVSSKQNVTDEASAIEALGLVPLIIEGRRDNIKITYSEDLLIAENWGAKECIE